MLASHLPKLALADPEHAEGAGHRVGVHGGEAWSTGPIAGICG